MEATEISDQMRGDFQIAPMLAQKHHSPQRLILG
jgi:hypothetical protein